MYLSYPQQQTAAQRAQAAHEAAVGEWAKQNAKLLYVDGANVQSGATKFFQDMSQTATELGLSGALSVQQLETIKGLVLAKNRPTAAAPMPSAKANRQPQTGAQPKQLSPEEFFAKFNTAFGQRSGLKEYVNYLSEGKLPAQ